MKKLYTSNRKILISWIEEVQQLIHKQGKKYTANDGGEIDVLMKALSVIYGLKVEPTTENIPVSNHFQVSEQWTKLMHDEIFSFNARGDEYICTMSEALIKISGIKRVLDDFRERMYFRGEHNFGWELIPRLGRSHKIDWEKTNSTKVTDLELELVQEFQQKVLKDNVLKTQIFGTSELLDFEDSGWWSIIQHYDEEHGTRMIDLTSSIFCALYFGCVDWNGSIDSNVDGKLYFFPYQTGRGETDSPDLVNGELVGAEDRVQHKLQDYFTVTSAKDFPRFKTSPVRNDRALSQDGYFTWQPKYTEPLQLFQHFPFRIHREYKNSIVKELGSIGYTKERILSESRFGLFR